MGRIVVTGATGKLGSGVLKNLLKLVPADDIIVSQYNPSGSKLKELGVEVYHSSLPDKPSLSLNIIIFLVELGERFWLTKYHPRFAVATSMILSRSEAHTLAQIMFSLFRHLRWTRS